LRKEDGFSSEDREGSIGGGREKRRARKFPNAISSQGLTQGGKKKTRNNTIAATKGKNYLLWLARRGITASSVRRKDERLDSQQHRKNRDLSGEREWKEEARNGRVTRGEKVEEKEGVPETERVMRRRGRWGVRAIDARNLD